jgi:hypothetical protein
MLDHAQWPTLWPRVFSTHELFHLFVMGGSLSHYWFMLRVVAPFERLPTCPLPLVHHDSLEATTILPRTQEFSGSSHTATF